MYCICVKCQGEGGYSIEYIITDALSEAAGCHQFPESKEYDFHLLHLLLSFQFLLLKCVKSHTNLMKAPLFLEVYRPTAYRGQKNPYETTLSS